jgi:hypothetical protein
MARSQAMNQGSALALPMVAPALWIIWSLCQWRFHPCGLYGRFTNGGSSLVDYMVASPALFDCATSLVVHKCPLFCGKGCDFDHMPLSLNLQLLWQHVSSTTSESRADIRRFKHDANKCTQYC